MLLKENNTLYRSVILPNCADKLFDEFDDVKAHFEANLEIKFDKISSGKTLR